MLFGNNQEGASHENRADELSALEREITVGIQKAKDLADSCKVGSIEAEFATSPTGVLLFPIQQLIFPEYKEDVNYSEQFWKNYLKNELTFAMVKDLSQKVGELEGKVKQISSLSQQYRQIYRLKNRKKNRRPDVEIQKIYQCPYERCYRNYGSDVSLNLHIKLKHRGGNKSDRQKLASQICEAEEKGLPLPEMRFNLSKSYLEQYRLNFKERLEKEKNLIVENDH